MRILIVGFLGLSACLDLKYEGEEVSTLTGAKQNRFCTDAAEQYTKFLIGQGAVTCSLEAEYADDCESAYDECIEEYPDVSEVNSSSAGVVYGSAACLEIFEDGDFSDCEVDADVYIECIQENQEALNDLDAEQVCSSDDEEEISDACEEVLEDCPENPMSVETIVEAVDDGG